MAQPSATTAPVAVENQVETPVTSSKYLDLIQRSEKEKGSEEALFANQEAKLQLQSDILATQRGIANLEKQVILAKGSKKFDSKAIIKAQVELEAAKNGLVFLRELEAELF